jgi:thiol-disulfide isomerase/thioredoxin
LDGVETTLSAFRGQVVILDFWASWCKPCTRTFPEVDALVERLRDEGVVLLVVSLDKDANTARTYLQENGFSTDHVLYGSLEEAREVKGLYGVVGIPHTFLIDRDGLIRFSGYPNGLTEELIRAWL